MFRPQRVFLWLVLVLYVLMICGTGLAQSAEPSITQIRWSPDGLKIAAATTTGTLRIYAPSTGNLLIDIPIYKEKSDETPAKITDFAWSPDNQKIVTTGWHQAVSVWETDTGVLLGTLTGSSDAVASLDWSRDGRYIVGIRPDVDYQASLWDAITYQGVRSFGHQAYDGEFSPDLDRIALGDMYTTGVFDTETGDFLFNLPDVPPYNIEHGAIQVQWTPDGKRLIGFGLVNGVNVWDLSTHKRVQFLEYPRQGENATIGSYVDSITLSVIQSNGYLTTWDLTTGKQIEDVPVMTGEIAAADYSPYDGQIAYSLKSSADLKIVVPSPSLGRLKRIASACVADSGKTPSEGALQFLSPNRMDTLTLTENTISTFVDQVEALPANAIPAACAADLIAVAQAVIQL